MFSNDLKLLWQGEGQTGHYPYAFDVDGDGKDEFVLGYTLWNHDGRQIVVERRRTEGSRRRHCDGEFLRRPESPPMVYACGSDEGFILFDREGKIIKHVRIGHAQSPSIARYRTDVPGLQLLTVNYWRNPGILSIFDHGGNLLKQGEPIHTGSPLLPVNWRGDGVRSLPCSPPIPRRAD